MTYKAVFNFFVAMLALIGGLLVVVFWIVFREENTIHPIYRTIATLDDDDADRAILTTADPGWTQNSIEASRATFVDQPADTTIPLVQSEEI
jgi:hypothetical protein